MAFSVGLVRFLGSRWDAWGGRRVFCFFGRMEAGIFFVKVL